MRLFIASDHAGLSAKESIKDSFDDSWEFVDLGPTTPEKTDYPIYAKKLVQQVLQTQGRGILLCGSGLGMSMAANRYQGIRAALVSCVETAQLAGEHNDANILCLGGRFHTTQAMQLMIEAWAKASFQKGRHRKRIDLFSDLGEKLEFEP